ncbi:hypothetical protein ACHAWF_002939 [Thalassiosira exigua]
MPFTSSPSRVRGSVKLSAATASFALATSAWTSVDAASNSGALEGKLRRLLLTRILWRSIWNWRFRASSPRRAGFSWMEPLLDFDSNNGDDNNDDD